MKSTGIITRRQSSNEAFVRTVRPMAFRNGATSTRKEKMSPKSKKTILLSFVLMIVFAGGAHVLAKYQEKAKFDLLNFIRHDLKVEAVLVNDQGVLTHDAVTAVKARLGDWRDARKEALWDRFRYRDYWLSVLRTLTAVALFIGVFVILRGILAKVYIPKTLYEKFRQTSIHGESEKKGSEF